MDFTEYQVAIMNLQVVILRKLLRSALRQAPDNLLMQKKSQPTIHNLHRFIILILLNQTFQFIL